MNYLLPSIRFLVPIVAFLLLAQVGWAQPGCTTGWSTQGGATVTGNVAIPPTLGGGTAPYVDVDIFLDQNCYKRFNLSVTPFETDCNIIEYYNASGILVGVEDQDFPGTSTFIFDVSDMDGMAGIGGYPSGVADNPPLADLLGVTAGAIAPVVNSDGIRGDNNNGVDYRNEGYSPDYRCNYEPVLQFAGAEAGQFYFFRSVRDENSVSDGVPGSGSNNNAADGYHFFDPGLTLIGTTYRAIRIRSVQDGSPPIIAGTSPFDGSLCVQGTPFDNCPTDVVGDPRAYANLTHDQDNAAGGLVDIITDNDPTASAGTSTNALPAGIGPLTPLATVGADQVRALTCYEVELLKTRNSPAVNPTLEPYIGGPIIRYGTEPAVGTFLVDPTTAPITAAAISATLAGEHLGTGFIDSDSNNNDVADYTEFPTLTPFPMYITVGSNVVYNGFADSQTGSATAGGTGQVVRNTAPDGCQGGVTTTFSDGNDISRRGDIYDNFSLATPTVTTTSTFGGGQDGRFRYCYTTNRTWRATDQTGNIATCIQDIDVVDDFKQCFVTVQGNTQGGSPYFLDVGTVQAEPENLMTANCAANINSTVMYGVSLPYYVEAIAGFTNVEYSPGYDNTPGLPLAEGAVGYEFPVFNYADPLDATTVYSCGQVATLDGFVPVAADNCGVMRMDEITPLYDYGLDGDFGDDNTVAVPISPFLPPTQAYNNRVGVGLPAYQLENVIVQLAGENNDDASTPTNPFDCSFYEYDLLKRWRVVDNCGFHSIAQRIYQIRDEEAPDLNNAMVTVGGSTLTYATNFISSGIDIITNTHEKFYDVSSTIVLPFSCSSGLRINTDFDDNCALDPYINVSYDVEEETSPGVYTVISTGNIYNPATGAVLTPGKTFRVTFKYQDPCGNTTELAVPVQTQSNASNFCPTTPFTANIVSGQATANYLNLLTLSELLSILSTSCTPITNVELVMTTSGGTVSGGVTSAFSHPNPLMPGTFITSSVPLYNATSSGCVSASASSLSNTPALPQVTFGCAEAGTTQNVTLDIYDCSSGVASLFATCTRAVNVTSTATLATSPVAVAASGTTTADGQIMINVTPTIAETYNVVWSGPSSGAAFGVAANYVITGLLPGVYNVTVSGNTSCATANFSVNVTAQTPLELKFNCPSPVVEGNVVNVQIAATSDFTNLSSIDFGVTLNSPAGATILDLQSTNGFAATTGGFSSGSHYFIGAANTTADVIWSTSNTNTQNLTDCVPFITVVINIPPGSSPGTLSVSLDGGTNGMSMATQDMGTSQPNVPLTFDPGTVPCTSAINPSTTASVTAGGSITFMSVGNGVSNTSVLLQNITAGTSNTASTGPIPSSGGYSFTGISSGDNVKITPSRTNGAGAGYVNVTDAILLARYVTGIAPSFTTHLIDTNSEILAGDVDYDGDIDFIDVIRIRQSVVGFAAQQYIKTDWVFYPTSTSFPAIPFFFYTSPLMQCFSGVLTASNPSIDFIGVKVGDVNQTASSFITPGPIRVEDRSQAAFQMEDQAIKAGEWVEMPIYAKDFTDLFAYQTNIQFDTDYLSFESVELGDVLPELSLEDFGTHLAKDGLIPTIWGDLANIDLKDGDKLFTLKFKAKQTAKSLKGLVELVDTEEVLSNAYDGELIAHQLTLDITAKASDFVLYPSTPNPFAAQTKISFDLPEASAVNLVVTDLTGRVVYSTQANMSAGYNEFFLNKSDLAANGVYYYQIQANNYEASAKVILMD